MAYGRTGRSRGNLSSSVDRTKSSAHTLEVHTTLCRNSQGSPLTTVSTSTRRMIAIAKPELGEDEAAGARQEILSGWVTQGPQVAAFEEEFARYVGASHACAVSNCTTALHLALHALGVGPGD